jgi:ABC-type transporter Mla subunit MlaD
MGMTAKEIARLTARLGKHRDKLAAELKNLQDYCDELETLFSAAEEVRDNLTEAIADLDRAKDSLEYAVDAASGVC